MGSRWRKVDFPASDGLLKQVNLIPPRGLQFRFGLPHFFSVSNEFIKDKCNLTDNEVEIIERCRKKIISREYSIEDVFLHYPVLFEKVKKNFSLTESSYYTLVIHVAPESGISGKRLITSLRIDNSIPDNGIQFFQTLFY